MIKEILEKATKEKRPIKIYAHQRPDGDAVASSKTLERFFKENGINAEYVVVGRPNNLYSRIVGFTNSSKSRIPQNAISIILDSSTKSYVENSGFLSSKPEDTYVIDHHEKPIDIPSIEEELKLPKENVLRNSDYSSTCEILGAELYSMRKLNPDLSTMLLVGMCTDTATFRHLKPNTLDNLKMLLRTGGKLGYVQSVLQQRRNLRSEVGLAKAFLGTSRIKVGDTYINYLGLEADTIKELENKYRVRDIQKKIFKLGNIEDTSINVVVAENNPNTFDCEFRSIAFCGDIDVFSIATQNGGGGHHNASGCSIKSNNGLQSVSRKLLEDITSSSLEQLHDFKPQPVTPDDKKLSDFLSSIDYFKRNPKVADIAKLQELLDGDVNYARTYENLIPFKKFMLRNEVLAHIPEEQLDSKNISLDFNKAFLGQMQEKYGASIEDLLDATDVFKELAVDSTTISVEDGEKIVLDKFGNKKEHKTH